MKKIAILLIVLMLLGVVFLSGCEEPEDNPFYGLEYINEEAGFGFNPPDGWFLRNEQFNLTVAFDSPWNDTNYTELVIISSDPKLEPYQGNIDLIEIAVNQIKFYMNNTQNFTILANNSKTINNMDAYELEFEFCHDEGTSTIKDKIKYILLKKGQRFFTTYITGPSNSYDKYIDKAEQSINTLVIV